METRLVYDRSESWEAAGDRNITVIGHARVYQNRSGTDTVVVYTMPAAKYVSPDRVQPLSATELAALAGEPVDAVPTGTDTGPTYNATMLGEPVTVRTLTDEAGRTTAHVARLFRDDEIVIVVVSGADRATVRRVLDGVTLTDADSRAASS